MSATPQSLQLLVVDAGAGSALLEQVLPRENIAILDTLEGTRGLVKQVVDQGPHLVIVSARSPDPELLAALHALTDTMPTPLILFAHEADSRAMEEAVEAGVSAWIADDPQIIRIRPVIDAALAQFRLVRKLRHERDETRKRLAERQVIDQAKSLLIQHRNMDEDQAYHAMRKLAMNKSQRLAEVADAIIASLKMAAPEQRKQGA